MSIATMVDFAVYTINALSSQPPFAALGAGFLITALFAVSKRFIS